ncbi:MAG: hypothetical protein ACJ77K_18395 [Bacteroidia bacterium]|jgi:hypothetical protein
MKNDKIQFSFHDGVLHVIFLDQAIVRALDLETIYMFGTQAAGGQMYAALFEVRGDYEVTDDGVEFIKNNPHNENVIAKAYVADVIPADEKTKARFMQDDPDFRPFIFESVIAGEKWLREQLGKKA